jgi:hypothetical protein
MLDREDPLVVGQNAELGLCRRHAPKPGDNAATGTDSLWPRVASDEWCGEWEPKID